MNNIFKLVVTDKASNKTEINYFDSKENYRYKFARAEHMARLYPEAEYEIMGTIITKAQYNAERQAQRTANNVIINHYAFAS